MTAATRPCANCGAENPAGSRFCNGCGAPLEAAAATASESRKTVTVLFCDLVGSTALGEQLDPETLRGLLTRSFDTVRVIVERHGGVLEKFIGDAAMAVFGIPRVHEDDALRAVRAAAEIREALAPGAGGDAALAWRTGIATGEVVAGDGAAGQRMVTGDAVNVAARLQQSAQPGEILITAETQGLVRDAVEVEPLGEITVKGRQAAIGAFRLVAVDRSAAGHERRLDAPMVGRQRQRRSLDDAFAEVRDQRICHLFSIIGTAGVGKSRLVSEFANALGDQARVVHGRCLSYGEGITYWPVAEIVREATGIGINLATEGGAELAAIEAVLGDHPDRERVASLIGQVIGVTTGEPSPDENPWAIQTFLEALASDRPLVVILDDLQWAQPLMLDLVEHIADWSQNTPILLIAMARPELLELRPTWGGGKRFATMITLDPLSADETGELVEQLLGRADLPATVFDRIRAAAEGNPLFVEEMLAKLIDDGALAREEGRWTIIGDLAEFTVPATIHALLAARLDGLGSTERGVLERGSVEGTFFHRDAVAELSPETQRETVGSSLMTLTRREFVAPERAELVGREAYRFRHQLIRDAAYQAIAKISRAELHAHFADWLEQMVGDRADEYRPIIGYHLEQAVRYRRELDPADPKLPDLVTRAATALGEAGEAAQLQADGPAAMNLLRRAVDLTASSDEPASLHWRLVLGDAMRGLWGATEDNEFLIETRQLAERLSDPRSAARAETYRLHARTSIGEESAAEIGDDARRLMETLEALGDDIGVLKAGLALAASEFWTGHAGAGLLRLRALFPRAVGKGLIEEELRRWIGVLMFFGPTSVEEALRSHEELARGAAAGTIREMRVRGRASLLALQGDFDEARALAAEGEAWFEQIGSRGDLASHRGQVMAEIELVAGYPERAAGYAIGAHEWLSAGGDRGFSSTMATRAARACLLLGQNEEAVRWAEIALRDSVTDDYASQGPARAILARVSARAGDHAEAERLAREAVAILDATDELSERGDMHADLAEVLLAAGRRDEAVVEFQTALENYGQKGHLVGVGRMEARLVEVAAGEAGPSV